MGLLSQLGSRKKSMLQGRMGYCLESRDGEIAAPEANEERARRAGRRMVICIVEVGWLEREFLSC